MRNFWATILLITGLTYGQIENSGTFRGITYGNGVYVAVSDCMGQGKSCYSFNGVSWYLGTYKFPGFNMAVAYGLNTFIACGNYSNVISSIDGISWVKRSIGILDAGSGISTSSSITAIIYDTVSKQFVAACSGSDWNGTTSTPRAVLLLSSDGINWINGKVNISNTIPRSIIKVGNKYIMSVTKTGGSGYLRDEILTSDDGINWVSQIQISPAINANGVTRTTPFSLAYGGNVLTPYKFVAVGAYGRIYTSSDGMAWTKVISDTSVDLNAVTWSGNKFVAVGVKNGHSGISSDIKNYKPEIYVSSNGLSWNSVRATDPSAIPDLTGILYSITWGGGQFVAGGGTEGPSGAIGYNGLLLTSPDGIRWTNRSTVTSIIKSPLKAVTQRTVNHESVNLLGRHIKSPPSCGVLVSQQKHVIVR